MKAWTQFLGCPDHPYTLLKANGTCVSCCQESEAREIEKTFSAYMMNFYAYKRNQKHRRKEEKAAIKQAVEDNKEEEMAEKYPRGTRISTKRFTYEVISRVPSEVDNGKKRTWKVRVQNLENGTSKWLTTTYIESQVRKADWRLEHPE